MADRLNNLEPDLVADVTFYATEAGGRTLPALPGYGCPCMVSKAEPLQGWDARLLLGEEPFFPGQQRRIGFVFLSREGASIMGAARHFFLWDGRFVGEATVCENDESLSLSTEN